MPYIGQEAATTYSTKLAVQQFNGDGSTTAFTLNQSVSADQDILVSVDGVIQDTSAYTVSNGTTLTFSPAPSSGTANIFVNYLGLAVGTVTHPATQGLTATTGTFTSDISTPTLGTSNFRAGVNAGNSIASGGNYNVVIGDEAGTALTTGDDNVAIGFEALKTEDEHGRNVAVGYQSLKTLNAGVVAVTTTVGYKSGTSLTTGVQNTLIGGLSGDALTDADYNVAVGNNTLTTDTQGSKSTAVGYEALTAQNFTSATDSNNTAVGYQAGASVTTGVQNTLIGSLAGDAFTDADKNTAVGVNALSSDTLGNKSVAVGTAALFTQNFTSATDAVNTAVGFEAGKALTTGQRNTAVGGEAFDANTTGSDNVAIGKSALGANTTAGSNTAVGKSALEDNTEGTNNTAVGKGAGGNVTIGVENTCIGKEAGTVITNGDYNVIIGSDSDTDNANAQSRIAIGFNVSNGTDNSVKIGSGGNFISNTFTSNATWAHSSDERLKENIEDDTLGLDFINDLRPVTFTWKRQADVPEELKSDERFEKDTGTHHGMIAQEVKAALDKAGVNTFTGWSTDDGDGTQMVSEDMFVYPLINALQELSEKNDALEARLAALEAK